MLFDDLYIANIGIDIAGVVGESFGRKWELPWDLLLVHQDDIGV